MQTITDKQAQALMVMGMTRDQHLNECQARAFWLVDGWAVRLTLAGDDRGLLASVRRPHEPREWATLDACIRHVRELQAWGGEHHFPIEVA